MNLTDIAESVKQFVLKQEKNCRTRNGVCYPKSDWAYTPSDTPSDWKLLLAQGSPGNITKLQLGKAAAAFSSGGFRGNRVQLSADEARKAKARIRREYSKLGVDKESMPDSIKAIEPDTHIWKDASGQYRWLAAYTNNFRDNDNPPEIISSQAHEDYDKAVNSGEWPMPEVWLWHYPYPIGQTNYHYYDKETGFCIAGGTIDKEWAAEGIIESDWRGVSHGMPRQEIKRDEKDKTIITRRRTREITFLPTRAAANNLAFHIISKESSGMNENKEIPAHKREEFIAAFGEERVQQMEQEVAQRSQKAKEEGTESKEQSQEAKPDDIQQQPKDADVIQAIQILTTTMQQLVESNKELTDRVKALETDDGERLAQKAANIPPASLAAYVKSQLFSKENEVSEKGKGPKEVENKQDGSSGLFFVENGWTEPFSGRMQQ